jgi:hypothetical protein
MTNIEKLIIDGLTTDIEITKKMIERLKDKVYKMESELRLLTNKTNNNETNNTPGQA